jgi:hypothetical protein
MLRRRNKTFTRPDARHVCHGNGKGIGFIIAELFVYPGLSFDPVGCVAKKDIIMPITTLKVLASVLQLHGPGATIQSDHQGIDAILNDLRGQNSEGVTQVYFRRGAFVRGGGYGGGFRRAGYHGGGGFRRGGFIRGY